MKKIGMSFCLMVLLMCSQAFTQTTNKDNIKPAAQKMQGYYFGFGTGMVTGSGLSFKYWPEKWGVQINLLPVWQQDYANLSVGLSGLYRLNENNWNKLFLYSGVHYFKDVDVGYNEDQIHFGGGFGVEFIRSHFAFDTSVGFHVLTGKLQSLKPGIYLSAEFGIYYRY